MEPHIELRESRKSRAIERSRSYSEAMKNSNVDGKIVNLANSQVYTNEDIAKGKYRLSQSFVNGADAVVAISEGGLDVQMNDSGDVFKNCAEYLSLSEETDEDNVITMKIDVEEIRSEPKFPIPSVDNPLSLGPLTQRNVEEVDMNAIEVEDSSYYKTTSATIPETSTEYGHAFPVRYSSRRKRKQLQHFPRARHGGARRKRSRRVVFKSGEENVPLRENIPRKSIKYMRDVVNTVLNSKWRFIICLIVVSHFLFWVLFATIWYTVTMSYQDDFRDGKEHCVTGTSSFAGMLMMAVETQMTIGYGVRYPNEECPEAIIVMVLEVVAGTALSGGLSSLLFAKLVRPQKHVTSVGFSGKAAICLRDGKLCLQFRVWDLMCQHTVSSTITAYMLKPIRTLEGEHHQNYIHQLELKNARSFLLWPITVVHIIDEKSPLYLLSAQDMMDYRFEIVVCLTGASQSMGTTTQSRSSYLSKEIIWGYRFMNVLKYCKKEESYVINVENLHSTEQAETPLCSAQQLHGLRRPSAAPWQPTDAGLIYQGLFSEESSLLTRLEASPSGSFSDLPLHPEVQANPGRAYRMQYAPRPEPEPERNLTREA